MNISSYKWVGEESSLGNVITLGIMGDLWMIEGGLQKRLGLSAELFTTSEDGHPKLGKYSSRKE